MPLKTIFLALFCSLFLWGCSNKEGALFAVTNNGTLTIEPGTSSIHKGTTQAYRAFMIDKDGVRSEVTHEAVWVSSNAPIASIDDTGLATALSAGKTQIKASFSSLEAQADLQVFEQAIQSISVSPAESLSLVGLQNQFTATAVFADGSQQDVTNFSTWSSANPAIATIGSDGISTAVAPGISNIIASFNNASGTAQLAVSESAPKALILQANPLVLPLGSSENMQALLILENNRQIDVSEQVSWDMLDSSIATVDNNSGNKGFIESKKIGTTTVNANLTFAGSIFTANASVQVRSAEGLTLTLNPQSLTLAKGATGQFRVFAQFGESSTFEVTNDAKWLVEDTNIASIGYTGNNGGLATGLNTGSTRIQASFAGKDITAELIISDALITHIQITPSRLSLAKGTSAQLNAKAYYSDGSSTDITSLSSWVSASPAILHIETGTTDAGLATGVSEGLTQVKASYLGFESTIAATVTSNVIKDLQITPQNAEVANGLNISYQASAIYSDGSVVDVTLDVAWASLDPVIVSIISGGSNSGLATAHTVNHTSITATFDGITRSTDITVTNATVASLDIEPTNITTAAGIITQYSAFATLSNGQRLDVSRQTFWSSSKTDVAEIIATGTQAGLATALTAGTTEITASFSGQMASTPLTVTDASIIQLMIAPLNTEIIVSTTAQYSATAILSDGSQHDVTTQVSWTTENHSIVQIDSLGLATGLSKGSSNVIASYIDLNLSATTTLTVTGPEKPLSYIDLNPVSATVLINSTKQYTATAVFEDGSKQDVTDDVHWSSANQRLAIISGTGLAVGVSAGVTKIRASATYFGISYSSQIQLTVEAPTAVITAIQVLPNDTAILIGASQSYIAEAVLSSGVKIDVTDQVIWTSSDNSVANINSDAIAKGLSDGVITISADLTYAGSDYHGEAQLTVLSPSITIDKIVLEPFNSRIIEGDTLGYSATAYLSDKTEVDVSSYVIWQSNHPEFSTIEMNGDATGIAEGSSDISASLLYQGLTYNSERAVLTVVAATTVNNIVVTPRNKHIQVKETLQYQAYALLSDSSIVEIHNGSGVNLIWSADNSLVNINTNGLALATDAGISPITATVTYNSQTYSNSTELTIASPPATITEIQITPAVSHILIGTTQAYRATAILTDGTKLDITDESTWTSNNEAVATIDSSAIATANNAGQADITVNFSNETGNYSSTASLTVLPLAITLNKIVIEPFSIQLLEGHTQQYKAIAYLSDGSSQDITQHVNWQSSFPSIASIDIDTGMATAIAANAAATEITATLDYDGQSYNSERAALTVIAPADIQGIVIGPRNANILASITQQYVAYAILTDFSQIDITHVVSWSSSASQFATIDSTGLATGISAGDTTISADYSEGGSNFSDGTLLTVEASAITIQSMKVTPPSASALVNGYQQYRADITLSNGRSVDVTSNVTWTVAESTIASITQLGLAKGLAEGKSEVIATFVYQGEMTDANTLFTVIAPTIEDIKIAPHKAMILKNDEQQYIATALLSDGTKVDITQMVNWSSSNTASVNINSKGIATGTDVGLSDISAKLSYEGSDYDSNIAKLTVINAINNIQITPNAPTIVEGTTQQFTATAILTDLSQVDITDLVYWKVVNFNIASIEQTGLATGILAGTTDITIALSYQGTEYNDTETLHVQVAPVVDDFYITPGTNNILVGELHQLTATLVFDNGTTQDVTVEASWVSDDTTIAPMQNNQGLVFGLGEGSTHINASINIDGNTHTATASIDVRTLPLFPNIIIEPSFVNMPAGTTKQMRSYVVTDDGTRYDTTHISRWAMGDESIAEISATGLVTTHKKGTTIINASIENQGTSANLYVKEPDSGLDSVKFTPTQSTLLIGDTQQFTATAFLNDGTQMDVTDNANTQWTSFDTDIADFISTAGLLTAISQGTVTTRGFYTASPNWMGNSKVVVKTPDLAIDEIIIVPEDALLLLGTTRQYRAYALMSDGTQVEITQNAAWSVANSLIVEPQNTTGLLLGRSIGSTSVKVVYDYQGTAFSSETQIFVIDSAPSFLEVTPAQQTLSVNESHQYTAILHMENGQILDVTATCVWAVDEETRAHIDNTPGNTGLLTTLAVGDVIVTAHFKGQLAQTAKLTVSDATVASIQVTPADAIFPQGSRETYTAIAYYSDNSFKDISHQAVWISGDTGIADVHIETDREGAIVTGIDAGTTTITARYQGQENTVPVTITAATLDTIIVTPLNAVRNQENSLQYTATGIYSDLSTADITDAVTWSSSVTDVARIEDTGLAHTRKLGETQIQASLETETGTISAATTLTVIAPTLLQLRIEPQEILDLPVGNIRQLTAYALLQEGEYIYELDVSHASVWSSSSPDYVSVSNADNHKGRVQALQQGCVTIYANYEGVEAEASVCASAAELLSIDITPKDQSIATHSSLEYSASGTFSDDRIEDITADVTWISDNSAVATINENALAEGITEGTTTIIASYQGITTSTSLTVTGDPITQMWITPYTGEFPVGTQGQLRAHALFTSGSQRDVTDEVEWLSQTPATLYVNNSPGSKGISEALAVGQADVIVTHKNYDDVNLGPITAEFTITAASLVEIQVLPFNQEMSKGLHQQYIAIGKYNNQTHHVLSDQVVWHSSDLNTAFINHSGMLSARTEGTATISASLDGVTGQTEVTVTAVAVKSLSLSPYEESLHVGTHLSLKAIAVMTDNSIEDVTLDSQWMNNSPSILGLTDIGDDKGQIQGLTTGTGNIAIRYAETSQAKIWQANSDYIVSEDATAPTGIRIEPDNISLPVGTSRLYKAYAIYPDFEQDISDDVKWKSSSQNVASINAQGDIKTHNTGATTVSADWNEMNMRGETNLTVIPATIDHIEVTPVDVVLDLAESHRYLCEAVMSNGDRYDITKDVDWTSSDRLVATIIYAGIDTGKAFSWGFGQTTITARYDNAGVILEDSVPLNVTPKSLLRIDIEPASHTMAVDNKKQFQAFAVYQSGARIIVTVLATWDSANKDIAVVDNGGIFKGRATAEAAGTVQIQATYHNVTGSAELTVTSP